MRVVPVLAVLSVALSGLAALAAPAAQQAILDQYAAQAKKADPAFKGFNADAGKEFFFAKHAGGTGEADSCTGCHTTDPKKPGETRAGQAIDPIAVSVNPARYTDLPKVEKWFGRNCDTVLGRECTVMEKGNFLAFITMQ